MSSEEKKGRLSEDDVGTAEETTNFEDRINATLDKILDDEDYELDDIVVDYEDSGEAEEDVDNLDKTIEVSKDNGEFQEDYEKTIVWNGPSEQDSEEEIYEEPEEEEEKPIVRNKHKSARPAPVIYVPVDDIDQEVPVPENVKQNKKHGYKGLRIFGLLVLMIAVLGGCAYGGISYYFSNRFFEGTWINGIDCSQKTAYEVEELMK